MNFRGGDQIRLNFLGLRLRLARLDKAGGALGTTASRMMVTTLVLRLVQSSFRSLMWLPSHFPLGKSYFRQPTFFFSQQILVYIVIHLHCSATVYFILFLTTASDDAFLIHTAWYHLARKHGEEV